MTLYVYITEDEILKNYDQNELFWYKDGLVYGDWNSGPNGDGTFVIEKFVPISDNILNNGSLYLHAFITKSGDSPDPQAKNFAKSFMTSATKQLNRYILIIPLPDNS